MMLASQQTQEVLATHGCYAEECCDRCSLLLGPVRFTRQGEAGIWCSRECRGDDDRRTIRKGGRPRKYKTENDRRQAQRRQNADRQKAFRGRAQRNGKPSDKPCISNGPQTQNLALSHTPLTPDHLALTAPLSGLGAESV